MAGLGEQKIKKLQRGRKVRETGSTLSGEKESCQVSFILRKQWEEMHMHAGKAKHIEM